MRKIATKARTLATTRGAGDWRSSRLSRRTGEGKGWKRRARQRPRGRPDSRQRGQRQRRARFRCPAAGSRERRTPLRWPRTPPSPRVSRMRAPRRLGKTRAGGRLRLRRLPGLDVRLRRSLRRGVRYRQLGPSRPHQARDLPERSRARAKSGPPNSAFNMRLAGTSGAPRYDGVHIVGEGHGRDEGDDGDVDGRQKPPLQSDARVLGEGVQPVHARQRQEDHGGEHLGGQRLRPTPVNT